MKTYDAYMAHPAGGERIVKVFDDEGDTTVVTVVWLDECGKTRFMHEYRHNLNRVLVLSGRYAAVTEDETMTTYQITERGLQQIKAWLLHEWCCEAEDVGDLAVAVNAYARIAEDAEDGEIELRAWETASGRIAYLRPERVAVELVDD